MARHLPAPEGTPLYVHLPFCVHLCPYCDFFSVEGAGQDVDGFLDRLVEELRDRAPQSPRTVFVGGGTPTYLGADQLERFLVELEGATSFRGSAEEVTVELRSTDGAPFDQPAGVYYSIDEFPMTIEDHATVELLVELECEGLAATDEALILQVNALPFGGDR